MGVRRQEVRRGRMRRVGVTTMIAAAVIAAGASPASAFFCTNANKNPDAGLIEFKDSTACEHVDCDNGNSRAFNSTGTGAYGDFGGGVVIFGRNGLDPAALVGSPDHGIVEAE